jgi:hypothetical protein
VLLDMLHDERQALRAANGAATRARLALENAEWSAACRRDDLEQIELLQNPPPAEHRPEVVKRGQPKIDDIGDVILFPVRVA